VPQKNSAWLQDSRKFFDDADVIRRIIEESEGRKKVDHGIEATFPSGWKPTHVAACVSQICAGSALSRNPEQMLRVVESVHIVSSFCEEMRMPALPAGNVEYPSSDRQPQYVYDSCDFLPIALQREYRLILEQILGIEIRLPPLRFYQKNTGSR
jgi:hypothetical protein